MATFIITYDLRGPNRDYQAMHEAIKKHSKWARVTESTWVVVTEQSASEIRDRLAAVADPDDRIFVVKSGVESAWRNSRCRNEWLKENL